jgi:hypothetical protein
MNTNDKHTLKGFEEKQNAHNAWDPELYRRDAYACG